MSVCIHIYTCIYIYAIWMHTFIYVYRQTCMSVYVCIYECMNLCIWMYVGRHEYLCTFILHVCMYTYRCKYACNKCIYVPM